MNRIRYALLTVFVLSLVAGRLFFPHVQVNEVIYLDEVASGETFSEKGGSPPHYNSEAGTAAFNTYDVTPGIRGYSGPIKLLLAMDGKGTITGIRILEHNETPNYVRGMERPEFLGQFLRKNVLTSPLKIDEDIDGVSRATVSVSALADTVRESGRTVAESVFGLRAAGGGGISSSRRVIPVVALGVCFILAATGYIVTRKRRGLQRLRDVSLAVSMAVLGFWLSLPFSILHVFNLALLRPGGEITWYLLVGGVALSLALAGRLYCGWLCPFGALTELAGRLTKRKWEVSAETDLRWRRLKYFMLGGVTAVVLFSGRPDYGNFETYVTLFSYAGNPLTWLLVAVCILGGLRVERLWCRYLCPVAAFTGLFCGNDERYPSRPDCPMGNPLRTHTSECIRCNRCYNRGDSGTWKESPEQASTTPDVL